MKINKLISFSIGIVFMSACISTDLDYFPTIESKPQTEEYQQNKQIIEINPTETGVNKPDINKALEIIYEGWTITTSDTGKIYAKHEGNSKSDLPIIMSVLVNLFVPIRQQMEDNYLIVTTLIEDQNYQTPDTIQGTIFEQQNGNWVLKHTGALTSYSGRATTELVKIGIDQYGVLIRTQYAHTGVETEWGILNTYISNGWQKIWETQLGGAKFDEWSYSSKVEFLDDEASAYYKIRVATKGTNSGLKQFEEIKYYSFDGSVYELISTTNQ
jgi:hypothetical protein